MVYLNMVFRFGEKKVVFKGCERFVNIFWSAKTLGTECTQSWWQFGLTWNDPENNEGMLTEMYTFPRFIRRIVFVKACAWLCACRTGGECEERHFPRLHLLAAADATCGHLQLRPHGHWGGVSPGWLSRVNHKGWQFKRAFFVCFVF